MSELLLQDFTHLCRKDDQLFSHCQQWGIDPTEYLIWLLESSDPGLFFAAMRVLTRDDLLASGHIRLRPGSMLPKMEADIDFVPTWLVAASCCPEDVVTLCQRLHPEIQLGGLEICRPDQKRDAAFLRLLPLVAKAGNICAVDCINTAPAVRTLWLEYWLQDPYKFPTSYLHAHGVLTAAGWDQIPGETISKALCALLPALNLSEAQQLVIGCHRAVPALPELARRLLERTWTEPRRTLLRIIAGDTGIWRELAADRFGITISQKLIETALYLHLPPHQPAAPVIEALLARYLRDKSALVSPLYWRLALRLHGGEAEVDLHEKLT